ncbi:hypothetical protein JCM8202_006263 [Rhodotorula sphaerocarpa]
MSDHQPNYGTGKDLPVLEFIWGHLTHRVPRPEGDLRGQVALVTGATSGLGFETAKHFARLNISKLVLPVRSRPKGEQTIASLYAQVPSFRGQIHLVDLDLSRLASIPLCVSQLRSGLDLERLDFAILNAGVAHTRFVATQEDAYEETMQVNVLATGLLAVMLLPLLSQTADLPALPGGTTLKPQLEIVASEVHYWVNPANLPRSGSGAPGSFLSELCSEPYHARLPPLEAYQISKLLDVFLARKLAALPAAEKVQVTATNPGLCKSAFRDESGPVVAGLLNLISWRAEFGSRTFLHAVLNDFPSGSYISAGQLTPTSTFSCSAEGIRVEDEFWADFQALCEKVAPETKETFRTKV